MKIKFVCEKCGSQPQQNEEKSNDNWKVYDHKLCEYCGGKLVIKIDEEGQIIKQSE